ncbi:hypothetical protein HanRHA438_Chr10g0458681 [Helianthus annuus]|nr:hypothetical protein HanRHA438_Chr10g0458681 [Helianthus annuus]
MVLNLESLSDMVNGLNNIKGSNKWKNVIQVIFTLQCGVFGRLETAWPALKVGGEDHRPGPAISKGTLFKKKTPICICENK